MPQDIYDIGPVGGGRLAIVPRPHGGDWLADDLRDLHRAGVTVLVSTLTAFEEAELALAEEAALAEAAGLRFQALPLPDRGVPASTAALLPTLDALVADLAGGSTVAVHCRMGIGRSSLLAAALLARLGWEADAAWRPIELARGRPVPDTDEQRAWVIQVPPLPSPAFGDGDADGHG